MADNLKSCPLCGSEAQVREVEHTEQVYCPNCGASTLWQPNARDHWNNRKRKKIDLMPCPICGGVGKVWQAYDGKYCVQCRKCGFTSGGGADEKIAADLWNRRVSDE